MTDTWPLTLVLRHSFLNDFFIWLKFNDLLETSQNMPKSVGKSAIIGYGNFTHDVMLWGSEN